MKVSGLIAIECMDFPMSTNMVSEEIFKVSSTPTFRVFTCHYLASRYIEDFLIMIRLNFDFGRIVSGK